MSIVVYYHSIRVHTHIHICIIAAAVCGYTCPLLFIITAYMYTHTCVTDEITDNFWVTNTSLLVAESEPSSNWIVGEFIIPWFV